MGRRGGEMLVMRPAGRRGRKAVCVVRRAVARTWRRRRRRRRRRKRREGRRAFIFVEV